jgi:hypothetical protein
MDPEIKPEGGMVEPKLVRRAGNLGWLAISQSPATVKIAVFGRTEDDAAENFAVALARWTRLLADN